MTGSLWWEERAAKYGRMRSTEGGKKMIYDVIEFQAKPFDYRLSFTSRKKENIWTEKHERAFPWNMLSAFRQS